MPEGEVKNIPLKDKLTAISQSMGDQGQFGDSMVEGLTQEDMGEYSRLNVDTGKADIGAWNTQRAENQAGTEQALNAAGRLVKIPATVIQNLASLADIDAALEIQVGGGRMHQV